MRNRVSVIIVNYKTADLTISCVDSVKFNTIGLELEIIIVDNNSKDNSLQKIESVHPEIKGIQLKKNVGFGKANNIGVKKASHEVILFLNSDIIIKNNVIWECFEFLKSNSNYVIGPKLVYPDGKLQKSTYAYIGDHFELLKTNLLLAKLFTFKTPKYKAIMGAFMMMRKEYFINVNGFDEDFFMYCEELDLCKRLTDIGVEIFYNKKSSEVIHIHGASSNENWVLRQTLLSRSLLVFKQKGLFHFYLSQFLIIINCITNGILVYLLDKKYRTSYKNYINQYFKVFILIMKVPFTFKKKMNSNKMQLKST